MVMARDPNDVRLPTSGAVVGFMRSWGSHPEIFEGWLNPRRGGDAVLVVDGADRGLAAYGVLQRHLEGLLSHLSPATGWELTHEKRLPLEREALDCCDALKEALREHFAHARRVRGEKSVMSEVFRTQEGLYRILAEQVVDGRKVDRSLVDVRDLDDTSSKLAAHAEAAKRLAGRAVNWTGARTDAGFEFVVAK